MAPELIAELKDAAGKVDGIIACSTFPEAVEPAYLAGAMRSYPANGGKRLRPVIFLWSAAAAGGNMDEVLPAASALEIFHNWTLVHDDIIDDDDVRRSCPTAHIALARAMDMPEERRKKFGCDMAILAGDLMQGWAFDLIDQSQCNDALKLKLAAELRKYGYIKLVSGEAVDVEMSYRNAGSVTLDELYHMQSGKTGALLHYACRAGWMAGKGCAEAWNDVEAQALGRFGDALALAFQLRDDYLGIFGEISKFGKPIGSDLQEGKATLLLIHALENLAEAENAELRGLLFRKEYKVEDILRARELFYVSGSVEYLQSEIARLTAAAREALSILPDNKYKMLLLELADYLVDREK